MDSFAEKKNKNIKKKCSICNNKLIKSIGHHPDFSNTQIFKCFCCGVIFTNPIPKNNYLAEIYTQEYREIRNESPSANYLEKMSQRAKIQKQYIEKNLSLNRENLSVLDIGCGAGLLLKEFVTSNNKLYGFEPDTSMYLVASEILKSEKVKLWNQAFDTNLVTNEKFDIILLSHVLEHIPDPKEFINQLLLVLSQNGVIFIEVPHDNFRLVCEQIDSKLQGLMHLYFFNPSALKKFIYLCNAEVKNLVTCGRHINTFSYMYKMRTDIKGKIKWNLFWYLKKMSKLTFIASSGLINRLSPFVLKKPTSINWEKEMLLEYKNCHGIWIRALVCHRNS